MALTVDERDEDLNTAYNALLRQFDLGVPGHVAVFSMVLIDLMSGKVDLVARWKIAVLVVNVISAAQMSFFQP